MANANKGTQSRSRVQTPLAGNPIRPWAVDVSERLNQKDIVSGTTPRTDVPSFAWSVVNDSGTAKVKIGAGVVLDTTYGATTAIHSAAEVTNIVLASGYNVIHLKYTIGTSAAIQTSVATSTTEALALAAVPANTETEIYYPLHCIRDHTENLPAQSSVRLFTHIRQYESDAIKADAGPTTTFPAKILTHAGSGLYTWKEVQANSAYTGWQDTFTGQRTSASSVNALESNLDTAVDADTYVLMNEHVDEDGVVGFSFTGGVAIDLTTIDRGDGTSVGGTTGDILYYHSTTKWTRLAAGTTGDVLVMGTTYPEWETPTDC